jgi:hypothetical protein
MQVLSLTTTTALSHCTHVTCECSQTAIVLKQMPSWNPVAYGGLVLLECNMNMMGHCGYRRVHPPKHACACLWFGF